MRASTPYRLKERVVSMDTKIIDNRYEISHLLGQGLWGEVYKVLDLANNQAKALKIVTIEDPFGEHYVWFKEEFHLLAKLKHLNIVQVMDFGFAGRIAPYFTMEFMEGGHLSLSGSPHDDKTIVTILSKLCLGLQYIHSRGYIHGDIKPENILVGENDPFSGIEHQNITLKISDFSLSESVFPALLKEKIAEPLTGTLPYIAPEKFFGNHHDYRSDLFALGVLLYQLATGYFPFSGKSPSDVITNIISKNPVPPTRYNGKLSEKLEFIIMRLLEKEPLQRFQSAREVINALGLFSESYSKEILLESSDCAVIGDKFVGRESELSQVRDLLEQAGDGQGQALSVFGETGIGKTRLIEELKIIGQLNHFKVAQSSCPREITSPLKPVLDIVGQLGFPNLAPNLSLPAAVVERLKKFVEPLEKDESIEKDLFMFEEQLPESEMHLLFDAVLQLIEQVSLNSKQADSLLSHDEETITICSS